MRVSTDVGGTFTDYVIYDKCKIKAYKTLTTKEPSRGIIKEIGKEKIEEFSHGTTIAINSVIEKKGSFVVFFTTKGFKDLVNIGRQTRKDVYSFICKKPKLPVKYIVEVEERTLSNGKIIKKIEKEKLIKDAEKYQGKASVAVIGFINSYINPENEIFVKEILKKYFSIVIASHKIRQEIREYERFSTSIIEGYITPILRNYIRKLESLSSNFYIMQSNGGKSDIRNIRAVNMIMSGPAGGVSASIALCKNLKIENAIVFDMGGTSADVSAIVNYSPLYTNTIHVRDIPIKALTIDIESIGAGGGSIAWIDDGGALKVGPRSAGSIPGPACYNKGGKEFTVSDANLLVGILGKKISKIILEPLKSEKASLSLCKKLNIDKMYLSSGVLRIVNNNMVSAMKRISIGRGYDPREFSLISFGGAGPMHACSIAEIIGIKKIIIPPMPGAFSALGIMLSPIRFDYVKTILISLNNAKKIIPKVIEEFNNDLKEKLSNRYKNVISHASLDMRYYGQGHEINIPISNNLEKSFHKKHFSIFGFKMKENPIEVVNVKMVAELPANNFSIKKYQKKIAKVRDKREVYWHGKIPIYKRDFHGFKVDGPCIIEEDTATTFVAKDWIAYLDLNDVLHLERV